MPVYDYSYRTWQGERSGPMLRWLAIPKYTFMQLLSKRMFLWIFTVAWFQFVLRAAYIYLLVNPEFLISLGLAGHLPQPTPERSLQETLQQVLPQVGPFFFKNMIDVQLIFCFLLAFVAGSDLISRDLAHRAFVLYASKPISRWEYFLGKFLTLFVMMMALTWFQAVVLYVLQTAVSPPRAPWRLHFWHDSAWIFVAITAYSAIVSATLSLLILAASSMVKNGRYAGMALVAYIIGASVVGGIMTGILRTTNALTMSPFLSVLDLGYRLFHLRHYGSGMSLTAAWIGVTTVCGVSGWILWLRLRGGARYGT